MATSTETNFSVCLGVSGSVAAVKTPELCAALLAAGVCVDVVLTDSAVKLLEAEYNGQQPLAQLMSLIEQYPASSAVTLHLYRDSDEWDTYAKVGSDPVLHIELAKRNSLLLIAPLCANTLASCALGMCGSLLTSVVRAWYYDLEDEFAQPIAAAHGEHAVNKPFVIAPAMNTFMWHQRVTSEHLSVLQRRGVHVVPPVSKALACGDTGMGAMASVPTITNEVLRLLSHHVAAAREAREAGKPAFEP